MPDAADRQCQEARERAEREVAALQDRLVAAEAELAAVPDLREALARATPYKGWADTLQAELDRVVAERDGLAGAQTALAELKDSSSWRLTAPLRRVAALLRRG